MVEGDPIPDIVVATSDGGTLALRSVVGRALVVYFYPRDDTPGCTREAQDFSRLYPAFRAAGADVLGISRDPAAKHRAFADKHALSVPLASDLDQTATTAFGTWVEKSLYGRTYFGIERATFLFDAHGRLARLWRRVRVAGHADEVLAALGNL